MSPSEKAFRVRIAVVCACGALVLIALAVAQAKGALRMQTFTVLAIVWWVAMFVFLLPAVRGFNREIAARRRARIEQGLPAESREDAAKRIRGLRRYIVLACILFPLLLWANSDQPRSSQIAGAVVWLLLIGVLIRSLVRRQKKFNASENGGRGDEPQS